MAAASPGARGHSHLLSPLFKGKVRDASASAQIEHKGGKWVFSELKNEPVCSHFYCITSCLLAHCAFGRFFFAVFSPLFGGNDGYLGTPGRNALFQANGL